MAPSSSSRDRRAAGLLFVLTLAGVMWLSEIVDAVLGGELDSYGIEPRDADGLTGIAAAPFLHGGFAHLASNTLPFVVLGCAIALSGLLRVVSVTLIVIIVGGLGTWLVARAGTVHVGASGLVFGYSTYLISRGAFNRSPLELAIGAVVALLWGGALLGGLVPRAGVSWQGHLFGALGGVVAAWLLARRPDRVDLLRPPRAAIAAGTVERRAAVTIDRQQRGVLLTRLKVEIGLALEAGPSLPGRRRLELCGRLLDDIGSERDAPGESFEITMPVGELEELLAGVLARIDRELERGASERPSAAAARAARANRIDEQLDARAACVAVLEAVR